MTPTQAQEHKNRKYQALTDLCLVNLLDLSPGLRVLFFCILTDAFCEHCGKELHGKCCHCQNDE